MNPDEMKSIIESAIEAKSFLPVWSYALLIILPLIGAFFGAYSKKMGEHKADKDDFKNALDRMVQQANTIEKISHSFLETREISRIKRDKIEKIYIELDKEREILGHNLTIPSMNLSEDVNWTSNIVHMLVSLYFKDELKRELDFYLKERKKLTKRILDLSRERLKPINIDDNQIFEESLIYFKNFNQATVNIEIALAEQMKNLIGI